MRMCGAFGKQQLKVCGERKSSWSPLTYSARFLKKPLGGDTRGLPGASATAGGPITSCPLFSSSCIILRKPVINTDILHTRSTKTYTRTKCGKSHVPPGIIS